MQNLNFEKVSILLVDPDRNSRDSLRMALHISSFRDIRTANNLGDMRSMLEDKTPDLLICSSEFPDGDFSDFASKIRHHEIKTNPFLPIITTTWNPTPEVVKKVIESGADDLLSKPVSTTQLLERIKFLVRSRKKFVVTSEYIGPARGKYDRGGDEIKKIDAPSTLKAKATGEKISSHAIQEAIDSAITEVNTCKVEGYADEIVSLITQIVPTLELGGEAGEDMKQLLEHLLYVAEDTARRLNGTKYDHVSELCESLVRVSGVICDCEGVPSLREINLLMPLSQAIQAGFANTESADTAREISAAI